jgi:hypothetical protein
VSLAVAHADGELARSARDASEIIRRRAGGQVVWFEGHWGFQYYMERWGARPLDVKTTLCMPGDILVVPRNNSSPYDVPDGTVSEIERLQLWQPELVATMDWKLGAGFYSDVWGALPFRFGVGSVDQYDVYRVERPIQFAQKKARP